MLSFYFQVVGNEHSEDLFLSDDDDFMDDGLTEPEILAMLDEVECKYSKACLKWPLSKRQKIGFQDQLLLNAGQKYCIMLQGFQFL